MKYLGNFYEKKAIGVYINHGLTHWDSAKSVRLLSNDMCLFFITNGIAPAGIWNKDDRSLVRPSYTTYTLVEMRPYAF